jgi:hypothetical protein
MRVTTPVSIAETVSVTVRSVTVTLPAFATTIRYVTASPDRGLPGDCVTTTVTSTPGRKNPVAPESRVTLIPQSLPPSTYARLAAESGVHARPTLPVTVNVKVAPGPMDNPVALHVYCVPVPATWATKGATNAGSWLDACPISDGTVSVIVNAGTVASPVFVTTIR